MAEAVFEIVLENLNSLIQKELRLYLGFDEDLRSLASLFIAIKATLADAEEKQFSDRSIKNWLQKLKDAAYILDDILDECANEALGLEYQSDKVHCSCLSSFHPKHVVFRYKIAKKMKNIRERLDDIARERQLLHLISIETVPERSEVREWRITTSLITEPRVYGREEDTKKVVDFLVGEASHSEDLSVYPIVGLGGLGKTTLAQLIFNHESVVNHFDLRIWVYVSEDFSLKRITKAIIEATFVRACEDLDLEPLQRRLQDLLHRKRYLLVLDDAWDDEQENWQRLKSILACGAKGSSILVTTRLPKVAAIMRTVPPHELSMLSDNDCWELFRHQAFAPNETEQEVLVVTGKEIVKKCGGVPLVAKALGGLLRFKRTEEEWLDVYESAPWTNFHLTEMALERRNGVTDWRETTSLITEPQVYGRQEDTKKVVDFLVGEASHSEDLSVYPIVGLGGLGKTTLAQLIFNHESVVNHFDLRIWVYVSEDFSLKRITKAIIEAVSGRACEDFHLESLQRRLQDLFQRKRYLLVLDDVWDDQQEDWQRLKSILACGAKGSSILVTTRLSKVANVMRTMPLHELSMLSNNDCWELFKHQAFGPNEEEQFELVVIGKEIVKKCGGVPLAAKVLGGLLRFRRKERE